MELAEIEAFVTVAASGSFTRAAEILHLSQPAVSRRIELLERDLDSSLFERNRSGARLTAGGEAFLPFAQRIVADIRDAAAAVRDLASGAHGSLSLAIVGTLASTDVLHRLKAFRNEHPAIRMTLRTANSHEVSRLVRTGEAQLGLRYFDDAAPGIDSVLVANERLVIVCAGDSAIVPEAVTTASDLAGLPWVSFPVGSGSSGEPFATALDRHLVRLGLEDADRVVIDSLTAQKRMIETDFGIGLMLESAVSEELRLGTLRRLDIHGFEERAPVHLVRRAGGYENGASQALVARLTGP